MNKYKNQYDVIDAIEDLAEMRERGDIYEPPYDQLADIAIPILKKQIPMKPKQVNTVWNEFQCPICNEFYGDDEHDVRTIRYCPHCGQAIDWTESEV